MSVDSRLGPPLSHPDDVLAGLFMSPPLEVPLLWYVDGEYWLSDHVCYVKWRVGWRSGAEPLLVTYESLLSEFKCPKRGRDIKILDAKNDCHYSMVLSDGILQYTTVAAAASMLGFQVILNMSNMSRYYAQDFKRGDGAQLVLFEPDAVIIMVRERALKCQIENDEMVVITIEAQTNRWPRINAGSCVARIPLCDGAAFDMFSAKLRKMDRTSYRPLRVVR